MTRFIVERLRQRLGGLALYRWLSRIARERGWGPRPFSPKLLEGAADVMIDWPNSLPRPRVGLVRDGMKGTFAAANAYWPRFQRFLAANQFPHRLLDLSTSNWLEQASACDIILWRPNSEPAYLDEAKHKIYLLEQHAGKIVLPAYRQLWHYEDKVAQYWLLKHYDLPVVHTFISFSEVESLEYVERCTLPLVAKTAQGSGSHSVQLITSRRQAKRHVRRAFGSGLPTYLPYMRQKNYVYLQDFVPDADHDLRVIVVGDRVFGYYRMRPPSDFRASGAGLVQKREIPPEAIFLALRTARSLGTPMLAVDMVRSGDHSSYQIIEMSIFIQIDTPRQLEVNGTPGYYRVKSDSTYEFVAGQYWLQELLLHDHLLALRNQLGPEAAEAATT